MCRTVRCFHSHYIFLFIRCAATASQKLGYVWIQKQSTIRSGVFNQLFIQYFNDQSAWGDQRLGFEAPLPLLAKTSLCTLMWFTNKCTYLKHNSLAGLHVGALKALV